MRICDKCSQNKESYSEINIILEDSWFDLCEKHLNELTQWLGKKDEDEKPVRLIGKINKS